MLGDFTVTRVIGLGGFSIVYMAHDNVLHRTVAIKEYLPITIAGRTSAKTVMVRSTRHSDTYSAGLQSFMREARLQARFTHPAMLEVYQVWEQNSTAYMAMRYYPGESLLALRADATASIVFNEETIRRIMSPVFEGVAVLHEQSVLHRDVSPDNILIMPSGSLVLLDFGSARMVVVGAEQSLTTVLKPGYAPVEQYIDDGTMPQGPWTDVYALGAVLYFLVMGTPPPQAVTRMLGGTLHEFEAAAQGRYSTEFISAVIASMTVQPTLRLQSVAALRAALGWPDEPSADALKSVLVTTLGESFNAEWRAAQIAVQTSSVAVTTPAASDAVTLLLASPVDHVRPVFAAVPLSNVPSDLVREGVAAEPMSSPPSSESATKSGFAAALHVRWLMAACVATVALALTIAAQPGRPVAAVTAPSPVAAASDSSPKLKLTAALPGIADQGPEADSMKKPPEVVRPRAAGPKNKAEETNVTTGVAATATAVPAATAPVNAVIAPSTASRASSSRQKSAACQRQLSKQAPSEAAMNQGDHGQSSDC